MKVTLYGKRYFVDKGGALYSSALHYVLGIPSVSLTALYYMKERN